jgi:serine/threonine-protein kinase
MPETPHPDGMLPPGTLISDRLIVVGVLGVGGLGTVYEVEHRYTHHRRAAKVLHPQYRRDAELVERFLREASAAGRIGNAHIVETFDAGLLQDGAPFIVMELLTGHPLGELLRQRGALEPLEAIGIIAQVCGAIQAAHEAGIIHRDLKPENLFVTQRDGRPFMKVLDFGISKFQTDPNELMSSTRSGIAMGTPRYMAPEQVRDAKNADARSDVYSLGAILHELLSGQPPFDSTSFADLTVKILTTEAPALPASVPPALARVVTRTLAKDSAARFQTAEALRVALVALEQPGALATRAPIPLTPSMQQEPAVEVAALTGGKGRLVAALLVAVAGLTGLAWAFWPTPPAPVAVTAQPASAPAPIPAPVPVPVRAEPEPVAVATPEPSPEPRPAEPEPVAKPDKSAHRVRAAPVVKGTADFNCSPAACTVMVDGRVLGETPLLKQVLGAGPHTAQFVNSETKASTRRSFEVKAGTTVKVPVTW